MIFKNQNLKVFSKRASTISGNIFAFGKEQEPPS